MADRLSNSLSDAIANMNIWSTTEQKIGTYGTKTVYRKMFVVGSASADTDTVVQSSFKSSTMDIIDIGGVLLQTDGSTIKLGGYYGSSSYSAAWFSSNGSLYIKSKVSVTKGLIYVIYAI